jgi:hypothetical protein
MMQMPKMTELETVRMENFALRILFMQNQLQQVQNERAAFIQLMERAYPGCEWREGSGLVEKEEAGEVESEDSELTPH